MSYPPQLPNPTRHITVTSPQTGISSLWSEEIPVAPIFPGSQTYRGRVWIADSTPADVMTGADGAKLELKRVVHPNGGTAMSVIDLPPGGTSAMHYTQSIDYLVIVKGTITLELTDVTLKDLSAGDLAVQQGTPHAWHNRTKEWARQLHFSFSALSGGNTEVPSWKKGMVVVVVPAKSIEIEGVELTGAKVA